MTQIEITKTEELPKCPFCSKDLDKIEKGLYKISDHLAKEMYRCPYCKKLLHMPGIWG